MSSRLSDQAPPDPRPSGPAKPRLSVVVITRNEAHNLRECLASVAFADEWVVVDQASTDGTAALAESLGARVAVHEDWPGFGPQKNRALALATGDWVLSLDADERVSPELAHAIEQAIQGPAKAWQLSRLTEFCGQWIHHCGWTPDHVLRLFPRGLARFSEDLVHERVLVDAGLAEGVLQGRLLHHSYRTPAQYWNKLQSYSRAWAQQQFAAGRKASMGRAAMSSVVAFLRSYFFRLGFLDGAMGFAVCAMQAQAAFGKYFELYCLHHAHPTPPQ